MQNEVQVGRLNAVLHKLLDMKEGAPSPTLATDIFPTITLEADRPEFGFLSGVRLAWGVHRRTAVAGQNGWVGLDNPAGSNTLIVIDGFELVSATSIQTRFYPVGNSISALGTLATTSGWRDSRWANFATVGRIRHGTNVGPVVISPYCFEVYTRAAQAENLRGCPVVLAPNSAIIVHLGIVNVEMSVSFWWRERAIEPSETR